MPPPPRLLLCLGSLFVPLAQACGVLVHSEVVHRASHLFLNPNSNPAFADLQEQYSPLLVSPDNAPYVQAGVFFPDWGYQCLLNTDDDSEAAHWPPFLIAAVEHINSKYGSLNATASRSPAEQSHLEHLISFIFAVASHQTADVTWHGIRLPTGLLSAMTGVDFAGNTNAAHRALDFGADFLLSARLSRMADESRAWLSDEWSVPIDDLLAIYERIGRPVTKWVLQFCAMRGKAALRSELLLGENLLDVYASTSPMMMDSVDSYYLGGLDEMSARTVNCWSNLTRWFADGISRDEKLRAGWGICDIFQAVKARGGAGVQEHPTERLSIWQEEAVFAHANMEIPNISVRKEDFGVETYSLSPLKRKVVSRPKEDLQRAELRRKDNSEQPLFEDPSNIATFLGYGHLGTSVSVGNFATGGELALAVGAPWVTDDSSKPGAGEVYIVPSSYVTSASSESNPKNFLTSKVTDATSTDQRFGTASTGLKILNSTFLAVSAPGPVTYDSGSRPSLPWRPTAPAGQVHLFQPGEAEPMLVFPFRGAELGSIGRRWWGENVIAADFLGDGNDWLVVGGSRSDSWRICEGRKRVQFGQGEISIIRIRPSAVEPTPDDVYVDSFEMPQKGPGMRRIVTKTGQAIDVDSWSLTLPQEEKASTPCGETNTYEYFGAALAFSKETKTLFVGAPGSEKVFAYRLEKKSLVLVYELTPDWTMEDSKLRIGYGGGSIVTGKDWIAVSAHNENVDGRSQVGVVRVYRMPAEENGYPEEVVILVPDIDDEVGESYVKFGTTMTAEGDDLYIGSQFAGKETGVVWWINVRKYLEPQRRGDTQQPLQHPIRAQNEVVAVKSLIMGKEPNAHFAHSLQTADLNGDGKTDLIVGVPYTGVTLKEQDQRFYGAVQVFYRL